MGDQKEDHVPDAAGEREEAPDWLIENIAELSRNTRSLYLIYVGALLYCAVTVVGVTDRQILLDEAVTLPIIGVDVSLSGFFLIAPLVAIGTFVYLQLYLQDLQSLKRTMRETYGKEEPGRLYPWIMNVVDHPQPGLVGGLQQAAVSVMLWWLLPAVLFLFGFSYLKTQEPMLGIVVTAMPLLGLVASLFFWHAHNPREESFWKNAFGSLGKIAIGYTGAVAFGILAYVFVSVAWVGAIPDNARGLATIDVSYQSLVTEQKYDRYWVDLSGKKLRGANLEATTLINADLSDARLDGANLRFAKLDSADLRGASLSKARLSEADLPNSNLKRANLSDLDLSAANLSGANLRMADLSGADLRGTSLPGAQLWSADLSDADLWSAELSGTNLESTDLSNADMWGANLYGANLSYSRLSSVNLSGANLSKALILGTRLNNARLRYARLDSAVFYGVALEKVDLTCSRMRYADIVKSNLTATQLCGVATLYEVKAKPGIVRDIETKCSSRLLKPEDDESMKERCPYLAREFQF